jgi:HlyD family secretion protein
MNAGMSKLKATWIVVCLALAGGAFTAVRIRQSRAKEQPGFETARVDRGRIVAKVTATGTLSAIVTVQVGSQVSGTIAALHADFNSTVTKGQLVAKIDPRLFDAAVQQSRANVAAANGNLAKAKAQAVDAERQAKRNAELRSRNLIAQADYDTAQANADAASAGVAAAAGAVEQAQAQLHQAEVNLAYTNITSPTSGTVISRNVDVGQTVAASLQAPTLFLIAEDLRKMQVDTSVAESDIGKLRQGMRATFTVDAYPNERFTGAVRQVRNAPQTVQNVVTYDAVIDVVNADLKLRPGMTANCTFIYAEKDDALRVPNAALRFRPPRELLGSPSADSPQGPSAQGGRGGSSARRDGGGAGRSGDQRAGALPEKKTVWVLRGGKAQPVTVKTGVSDGSLTEILEGELSENDAVITDVTGGSDSASAARAPQPGGFPRARVF